MEFPPSDWNVFDLEDFETAVPRVTGDHTLELLAQARPNGRVMDHWRLAINGTVMLEASFLASDVIGAAAGLPKMTFSIQQWPRDLVMRRNMTTSGWLDVLTMLTANELSIKAEDGSEVLTVDVVETLNNERDKTTNSASLRWAVCIGESNRPELQLQCLPTSAAQLSGKPIFKR